MDYVSFGGVMDFKMMSIEAMKSVGIIELRLEHIRASDKLCEISNMMMRGDDKQDLNRLKTVVSGYIKSIEIEIEQRRKYE